jgi:prepilin-type N-terminal cleavage/methylation domain-containing protein
MSTERRGFTLLEVLVALVIGAAVLLGARAVLEQLGDTADRVTAAAIFADREANTERGVRQLFHRAIVGDGTPFTGSPTRARFTSWCDVPAGWHERCTVAVDLASTESPPAVIAMLRTSAGDTFRLHDGGRRAALRYLDDPADGGQWLPGWPPLAGAPLALGIVTDHDTLLFRIGARR